MVVNTSVDRVVVAFSWEVRYNTHIMEVDVGGKSLDTEHISRCVVNRLAGLDRRTLKQIANDEAKEIAERQDTINGSVDDAAVLRSHLIFPVRRSGARRVSEQESRVFFSRYFEKNDFFYSVETPTRETYQLTGASALSARSDMTVYGSADPEDRRLNIELKAGKPSTKALRTDFEKLLREGLPGLWFTVLPKVSKNDWGDLEDRMIEALSPRPPDPATRLVDPKDLTFAIAEAKHRVHFVFGVLKSKSIERQFVVDFNQPWKDQIQGQLRKVPRPPPSRP